MTKFVIGAWVLLFTIVASVQMFDFWRLDSSRGLAVSSFCEGADCRSNEYKARVFYLFGDSDHVLIRDSADIRFGCGAEKASHWKAKSLKRGDSVNDVRGRVFVDRDSSRTRFVNDLSVFLPCDAPQDASAYGVAVAVPVWLKQGLADARATLTGKAASFDVTR